MWDEAVSVVEHPHPALAEGSRSGLMASDKAKAVVACRRDPQQK